MYESELKPVEGITDKIIFSSYPESANCIEKIQEMKEISLLLEETVLLVSKVTEIVENSTTEVKILYIFPDFTFLLWKT